MKTLAKWWKESPNVRMAVRNFVVLVASYVAGALLQGFTDWKAFAASAITTTITTVLGLTTPIEPFVGVKGDVVAVPSPPAVKER